jgi:hypothetical protein
MWNIKERGESVKWFWCEKMQEIDSLEDLDTDGEKIALKEMGLGNVD